MSQQITTQPPPPPPPEARRRQLLYLIAVGAILAVGVLATYILTRKPPPLPPEPPVTIERLRDDIAQLDQTDQDWRFAALEKNRLPMPADQVNAADTIRLAAFQSEVKRSSLKQTSDNVRKGLRDGTIKDRQAAGYEPVADAIDTARKLQHLRPGRFPVEWNLANPLLTELPHKNWTITVIDLLTLDAELRAHEGKFDESLQSVLAALIAVTTIGDEPMLALQYQRPGFHQLCTRALEESLHLGQAKAENLHSVQLALLAEADQPWLKYASRGERAGLHDLMTSLEDGSLTSGKQALLLLLLERRSEFVELIFTEVRNNVQPPLQLIHAWMLEYTTKFIKIVDRPTDQQQAAANELRETLKEAPREVTPLLSTFLTGDLIQVSHAGEAALRCAAVGMALERYRLASAKHQWPETLDDLVAQKYLTKVPIDPFDGKPLRYQRTKEGVVVYSVGPDGKEGKPGSRRFERRDDADLSFRLWNVELRHKPEK
jgi:hypothetical protein